MNIRDHKNLALSLLRTESEKRHISCLRKAAFLLGNMEPDMNLISYFRGFFGHTRMRGHNYGNVCRCMRRLLHRLMDHPSDSLWHSFTCGVLLHYVADSFTWPHNDGFEGDLRDHVSYEGRLHELWKRCDWKGDRYRHDDLFLERIADRNAGPEALYDYLTDMHERFLAEREKMTDDLVYIAHMTGELCSVYFYQSREMPAPVFLSEEGRAAEAGNRTYPGMF